MSALSSRPRPHSRLRWHVVLAGVGVLLVAAVLLQSAGAYETVLVAASGGTYVEGVPGSPRYLNPLLSQGNQVDEDIASLVFSGLTRLDGCGNVLPDLAESWDISDDGREYTFHLRSDAYWHDGVPVVADDVIFTIGVIQNPDFTGLPALARFWADIEATEANDRTVRFRLPEAYGPFLAATNIGILPAHLLSGVAVSEMTQAEFNRTPVGSGPFVIKESDLTHVRLEANKSYYGLERPYLEGIEFRFYRDPGEALRAHGRGEVMGVGGLASEYIPDAAADASLNLFSAPLGRMVMVMLDLESTAAPFLGEQDVRQALQMGLDRRSLVGTVLEGRGLLAHSPYSSCSWALDPHGPTMDYDLDGARERLETQGWVEADGDGIREKDGQVLRLELLATDDRQSVAIAQEIARQWLAIGVAAQVTPVAFNDLVSGRLATQEFDAALVELSLGGDPDPYVLWHSSQTGGVGQNYTGYVNREADELLEQARRIWEPATRTSLYRRFQAIFAEELPALPLYYPVYTYAVDADVRGVELGPLVTPSQRFQSINEWYVNFRKVRVRRTGVDAG